MARVMHNVSLAKWDTDWGDFNYNYTEAAFTNMTKSEFERYDEAVAASVTTVLWEARVACLGCPDHEPLFALPEEVSPFRGRQLVKVDLEDFFPLFAANAAKRRD